MTATTYAAITRQVQEIVLGDASANDPTVAAYMVARAALVLVGSMRGQQRAAELGYRLADEFASGDPK